MDDELVKLRAGIESLKRQLLEAILAELQESIALREAQEPTRLTLTSRGEILSPAQPMKRVSR